MINAKGQVLYVGKAKNLKNRVSSYFRSKNLTPKNQVLMPQVDHVEVIVTNSEAEALLLENNLIKKLKPKYNILLRDDKSYPYIYLSSHKKFPSLAVYRGSKKGAGEYFGPYPSAGSVRETLSLLQKIFKIRSCTDTFFNNRTRPCLQYQIKRCTAPCVNTISLEDYQQSVHHARLFLQGKDQEVIHELMNKMTDASEQRQYELAAKYRDQISSLRRIQEQQYITANKGDIDVIAVVLRENMACVQVLTIRGGRMLGGKAYFPIIPQQANESEIIEEFVRQYYLNQVRSMQIPNIVILSYPFDEEAAIIEYLSEKRGSKVLLLSNVKAQRAQWLNLAIKNASIALDAHLSQKLNQYQRFEALQKALKLENLPNRIECFDISHTMGESTVASCVVFDKSGPVKRDYRRYNISGIQAGDDYAALRQAIMRRYKKLKTAEGVLPDILFIDGGKGQLRQAEEVMEELQIQGVLLVGVAKGPGRKAGLEKLFFPGDKTPVHLPADSLALHVIMHIRDESHRFAITGHRQQQAKKRRISTLEQIEGIGAQRRQALLKRFGGLQELSRVSVEEIMKVPGISKKLAQQIYNTLHN